MGIFTEKPKTNTFLGLTDTPPAYIDYENPNYVRIKTDGTSLEFCPAIVGITSSGTDPPDPEVTNLWYNPEYAMFFSYDYDREDWLCISLHNYLFTFSGNIDGLYMSVGNVVNAYAHFAIPRDATITAVIATAEEINNPNKGFEIQDDGTILYNFNLVNWKYSDMDTNIHLNEGAKLQTFITGVDERVRNPIVTLELRWRYVAP